MKTTKKIRAVIATAVLIASLLVPTVASAHSVKQSKRIAKAIAMHHPYHWSYRQYKDLVHLVWHESKWKDTARNGLYKGLGQVACGYSRGHWHRKWLYRNNRWKNPRLNLKYTCKYIKARYGNPTRALAHYHRYSWY